MEFGPQDGEESAHPGVEQFAEHARHRWNPYRSISVLEQLHPSDDGKVGKRRGVTDDANEPRLPEPRSCRIGGECRAPPAPRRRRSSPKPPFARPVRGSGRNEFGELRVDDAGFRKAQGCLNVSAGEFRVALEQGVPGFPIGKLAEIENHRYARALNDGAAVTHARIEFDAIIHRGQGSGGLPIVECRSVEDQFSL